jgi:hypothetical protein
MDQWRPLNLETKCWWLQSTKCTHQIWRLKTINHMLKKNYKTNIYNISKWRMWKSILHKRVWCKWFSSWHISWTWCMARGRQIHPLTQLPQVILQQTKGSNRKNSVLHDTTMCFDFKKENIHFNSRIFILISIRWRFFCKKTTYSTHIELKLTHTCVGIWILYQIPLIAEIYFKSSMSFFF